MRVVCVAGARPNYMKVKPVMDALESRGADVLLVDTGQHYDSAMNDVFFEELGIRPPDFALGVGSGTHAVQTAKVMTAFEPLMSRLEPDVVVVLGDVNSTVACALVAAKAGVIVAHVEAGLRSRDWRMPEEINRVVTDRISDVLLAPSADAVANLRQEGYRPDQVHLVGNVMVDTLVANLERARARDVRAKFGVGAERYALMTLHRPSNVDDEGTLQGLLAALGEIAAELPVVFPVHPRTRSCLPPRVEAIPGLILTEPAGYLDFLALQSGASMVLTDSGGVQEETTALGVPCLTLRDNTERPITVRKGTNRLVGTRPRDIVAAAKAVLTSPPRARRPALWDGHAAERIADTVLRCNAKVHPRPTDRPVRIA